MPNAVGEQRVRPWHNFGIMLAVACVSAGVLTVFLTFGSISRQAANPSRPERTPNVTAALRPDSFGPSQAASAQEDRKEAQYAALASTPHLVAPAEWPAAPGVATNLPLAVEPSEEAATHHVLVSGLEASAFVIKGTELIEGTWIVPASELANARVVRNANVPGRTSVTLELRTDAGAVVDRALVVLLAPSLATGVAGAPDNR